jgi:hypothetical protein
MRLRAQCEEAVKHLSTGQEAMIDIDSLYEGSFETVAESASYSTRTYAIQV